MFLTKLSETDWEWHEGLTSSYGGPVLTAKHHAARLSFVRHHQNCQVHHWFFFLFMGESKFTLSTYDVCERIWRHHGECYLGLIIMTGLVLGQWWSGEANSLRVAQTSMVPPGAGQRLASCGQSVEAFPWWPRHWFHWLALSFPWHHSRKIDPQDTIHWLIKSMPRCCQGGIQARGGSYTLSSHIMSCRDKIYQRFQVWFLIQPSVGWWFWIDLILIKDSLRSDVWS